MKHTITPKYITSLVVLGFFTAVPFVALAHNGVDDGDMPVTDVHQAGGAALMKAFSAQWWTVLGVSLVIMAALCYGVWRYLQVPPVMKKNTPQ